MEQTRTAEKKDNLFFLTSILCPAPLMLRRAKERKMKKKIIFIVLLAAMFIISGCGLTEKDRLDIADGIGQVHTDGSPDVWTSENGLPISISHERFEMRADGTYCMTASVKVGKEVYMPPTPMCKVHDEWTVVAKVTTVQKPIVSAPKVTETKPVVVVKKDSGAVQKVVAPVLPLATKIAEVKKTEALPAVKKVIAVIPVIKSKAETPAVVQRAEVTRVSVVKTKPQASSIVINKVPRSPAQHPRKHAKFVEIN